MTPELAAMIMAAMGEAAVAAYNPRTGEALLAPAENHFSAVVVDHEPAESDSTTERGVVARVQFEGAFLRLPEIGSEAESH